MITHTKKINIWVAVTVSIAVTIFAGCKKKAGEKSDLESYRYEIAQPAPVPDSPSEFAKTGDAQKTGVKMSLADVVRSAKTWRPAYIALYGKTATDFAFPDIYNQQQKLSDYLGKNVVITFWTTWCPGCKQHMLDLIALRNLMGRDDLAILAVSFMTRWPPNTNIMVKDFVELNNINYTAISVALNKLPAPYSRITSIPCTFFIDPEGKIKLAAEGLMPLSDMKAVLEAEH